MYTWITYSYFFFFFLMIRRPPRSTLFPSRRSSDLLYSTVLDFSLVALMDHCPRRGQKVDVLARLTRLRFDDRVLKFAFIGATSAAAGILGLALAGPKTLRPTLAALGARGLLVALGAPLSS